MSSNLWSVAVLNRHGVVVSVLDDFASYADASDFAGYHLNECAKRRAVGNPVAAHSVRVYQPVRPGAAPLCVAGDAR